MLRLGCTGATLKSRAATGTRPVRESRSDIGALSLHSTTPTTILGTARPRIYNFRRLTDIRPRINTTQRTGTSLVLSITVGGFCLVVIRAGAPLECTFATLVPRGTLRLKRSYVVVIEAELHPVRVLATPRHSFNLMPLL